MAHVLGHRLHAAAHPPPHRRAGIHQPLNGRTVRIPWSGTNSGGHRELERRPVAVARGDPDPPAERSLHDEPAEIQPEPEPSLRPVATGGARFLEKRLPAPRPDGPALGARAGLEPTARPPPPPP